jgi:hypothetical protein
MKLSTLSLDHLGLVAAIIDALGISEFIDGLIPKTRECKLSHSEWRHAGCGLHGTTGPGRPPRPRPHVAPAPVSERPLPGPAWPPPPTWPGGERMLANPRKWRACSLMRHYELMEWKSKEVCTSLRPLRLCG